MSPLGRILITTFGLGFCRPASGTWGSLPPPAVCFLLVLTGHAHSWVWWGVLVGFVLVFAAACVTWGGAAEATFGRKDPGQVVADETAGMAVTLMFLPPVAVAEPARAIGALLAAFLLFRIADVLKPPPIHGLQRLPGGWGILVDDLAAGTLAGAIILAGALLLL